MAEWVKFYHLRWEASEDVRSMTLEERGLYITLLALQASNGTIPADLRKISRITALDLRQTKRLFPRLQHLFLPVETAPEERLANPVMRSAYEDAKRARDSHRPLPAAARSAASKLGASSPVTAVPGAKRDTHSRARTCAVPPKGGGGENSSLLSSGLDSKPKTSNQREDSPAREACPPAEAELPGTSPAPAATADVPGVTSPASPGVSARRRARQPEEPPGFTAFYELFPRRLNPRDALRAYRSEVTTPELHRRLMDRTRKALAGLFRDRPLDKIPYPATWIRSGNWKDTRSQLAAPPPSAARPAAPGGLTEDDYPDLTATSDTPAPPVRSSAARERLLKLNATDTLQETLPHA